MANHNNFGKDMEALFESYSKVEGQIPSTANTAMPRMLNEAHCDEEHEGGEETVKVELELELDKETAKKLHDQLMDEVVEEEPAEGELPAEDSSCNAGDEEHAEDAEHEDGEHEDGEGVISKVVDAVDKATAPPEIEAGGRWEKMPAFNSDEEHEDGEHAEEDGSCAVHSDEEKEDEDKDKEEDAEEVVAESYTAQYLLK